MWTRQAVAGLVLLLLGAGSADLPHLGKSLGVVSEARAQIALPYFCGHYHSWALDSTTAVETFPCPTEEWYQLEHADFCEHFHTFGLDWTTSVSGDPSVVRWCEDPANQGLPVPDWVYDYHYHENAGTSTTGPE